MGKYPFFLFFNPVSTFFLINATEVKLTAALSILFSVVFHLFYGGHISFRSPNTSARVSIVWILWSGHEVSKLDPWKSKGYCSESQFKLLFKRLSFYFRKENCYHLPVKNLQFR